MYPDMIQVFFQVWDDKISFLDKLFNSGRQDEAMTLCCTYIDGFARALSGPIGGSHENFVQVLRAHGGNSYLDLIFPPRFLRWVCKPENQKVKQHLQKIESTLQPYKAVLVSEPDVQAALQQTLSKNELQQVVKHLWRGTLADAVYQWSRNPFVHTLCGYSGISYEKVTYQGSPVPEINFSVLHQALRFIARHARTLSEQSGRLCIHV
jgi:hypothetical protein